MDEDKGFFPLRAGHHAADIGVELVVGLLLAARDDEVLVRVLPPERPDRRALDAAGSMALIAGDGHVEASREQRPARVSRHPVIQRACFQRFTIGGVEDWYGRETSDFRKGRAPTFRCRLW